MKQSGLEPGGPPILPGQKLENTGLQVRQDGNDW